MARRTKSKALSSGRPPTAQRARASLSASATRTLIQSHHRLNKKLHKSKAVGDTAEAQKLQQQIDELGGLRSYQQASILGQGKERGGDSSTVLMQWLGPALSMLSEAGQQLRLLEVGALSTKNACSRSKQLSVERIDLKSQSEGILQQDFMQRPLPGDDAEKFDILSLSLVLNYVPDAAGRGAMLKRTCHFLRPHSPSGANDELSSCFPALFLVLPAPCLLNSRYMDEERLGLIMESLGYRLAQRKQTAKLIYQLWLLHGEPQRVDVCKKEIHAGPSRNNFSVVLECQ